MVIGDSLSVMTADSVNVARVAEEFSLSHDFTWSNNVKMTGKSGAVHELDLVVSSKKDENIKIAVLNGISKDLVSDIMKFNAIASDCGIQLKALVVNKDLDDAETNLTHMYNIVTIDQRRQMAKNYGIFGVKELDDSINGAMRRGRVYLVSGKTGSGKTTTCTQFLIQGAKMGEKGAIILTDTGGLEYVSNAKTFTLGFENYYREGKIEVIELSDKIRQLKQEALESLKNRSRYIKGLTSEIGKIVSDSNISRLAIDPITPMIVDNDDFVSQFFLSLAIPNTFVLATSPVMRSDVSMYGVEEYFVAGVIRLDVEDASSGLRKAVIVKMRGGRYNPHPVYFNINSNGIVPARSEAEPGPESIFKKVEI